MASLFAVPGKVATTVRSMDMPALLTTFSYKSVILYLVVIAIIGFIIFMLLGKSFDTSWLDFRSPRSKVLSKGSEFWQTMPESGILEVKDTSLDKFEDARYTCLMNIVLKNTRPRLGGNIYRHLYHRGSKDLASPTMPAYGLPKRMNPGVFLDPNVNDILVYIDTLNKSTTFRESVRIADIPLDVPFRLAVLVHKRLLEVYVNCKLEVTKLLDGEPKEVENDWYGLSGAAAAEAKIQNLAVWQVPLTIEELTPLCPAQMPEFKMQDITCKSDKPAIDTNGMTSQLMNTFESGKDKLKSFF